MTFRTTSHDFVVWIRKRTKWAFGLAFFFGGGGRYSIDYSLRGKQMGPLVKFACNTDNTVFERFGRIAFVTGLAAFALALGTNQYFHGGVWGTLHNKSVRPDFEITSAVLEDGAVSAEFMRVEGPDVYGSFAVEFNVLDASGEPVASWDSEDLAAIPPKRYSERLCSQGQARGPQPDLSRRCPSPGELSRALT